MPTPASASFSEFVDQQPPTSETLPFVHNSRCELLEHLCNAGYLSPTSCDVFLEPLLYFFYGRPAFRSRKGSRPSTFKGFLPVCFVLKPEIFDGQIARAFPFDTGAANERMFRPHILKDNFTEFNLSPTLESIRKAVGSFFETNSSYFAAIPKPSAAARGSTLDTVNKYCALIGQTGENRYDDRRAAIEIQTRSNLDLKDNLLTVVMPRPFLDDSTIMTKIIGDWKIRPRLYNHINGTIPNEYVRLLVDKVDDYLVERGLL